VGDVIINALLYSSSKLCFWKAMETPAFRHGRVLC